MAVFALAAPVGAQAPPDPAALLLDDAGPGWVPSRCPDLGAAVDEASTCFARADDPTGGWLSIGAVPVATGFDPAVFVDAAAGILGGEPFPTPGLRVARGLVIGVEGPSVSAGIVLAAGGHVFTLLVVRDGAAGDVTADLTAVARLQQDRVDRLVDPQDTGGTTHTSAADAARLDDLLLTPEPGSGLVVLSTGDLGADVEDLRPTAGNPRVVDLVADAPGRVRILALEDGTPAATVILSEEAYGEFAATALGSLDLPDDERLRSPHLGVLPDAVGFRSGDARGVAFRQGRFLVFVALFPTTEVDDDAAAQVLAGLAREQAVLLPDGATAPYTFPSTAEGVLVTVLLTTALCGGTVAAGRLAAARQRGRTDPPAARGPIPVMPGDIADVTRRARGLRRRGLVLVLADLVAVNAIVLGVLGVTDVLPVPAAVGIVLVFAGLAGGVGFSSWWARSELRRLPGAGDAPSALVPSSAGLACGLVALVLLVVGTALVAMGLAGLAFGPGLRDLELARRLDTAPRWLAAAEVAAGAVTLALAAAAVRLARMWARAGGRKLRDRDRRPPVLYLRSFEDDALRVATIMSARRPFLELFTSRGTGPFEESVTWQISPYGPVVAVGRPGRSLASLGAARDHLPDEVWRTEVARRMAESRAIVVVIGGTEGLRWEMTQIVLGGHLARTVFVLPPAEPDAVRHRWHVTATALAAAGVALPALPVPPERALAAVADPAGAWWVAVADHRDEGSFRMALDEAIARLAGRPRPQPVLVG